MLQTPLAVLRRASSSPKLMTLAKALGVRVQRLSAVESGRDMASDEFLAELAKALGFRREQVAAAYLEGRRVHLRNEMRRVEEELAELRGVTRRRTA
jgi:transcriptional regulator with XRE-family HTH domain